MIENLKIEELESLISTRDIVIVDFWAEWCGPCKGFLPIFTEVANNNPDIKFVKVNVQGNTEIVKHFNVSSIPAIIAFKKGKRVDAKVGDTNKQIFTEWVEAIKLF